MKLFGWCAVAIVVVVALSGASAVLASGTGDPCRDSGMIAAVESQGWSSPLMPMFEAASTRYNVPLPLLLALGYFGSAFENRGDAPTIEGGYGVMALRSNATGGDSLLTGSELTGIAQETLKTDPAGNISAAAAVLDYYAAKAGIDRARGLQAWLDPVIKYAGLDPENSRFFAMEVFELLKTGLDKPNSFGEVFRFDPQDIGSVDLASLAPPTAVRGDTDYANATWDPAASCNYSTTTHSNNSVVIHTIEGTAAGCRSWFKNCSAGVSAHYVVDSAGRVWQMVRENQTAWQASCYNSVSVGIEHEGYAADTSHPQALYDGSAALTKDICERWGIPKAKVAPTSVGNPPGVVGHIDITRCCCGTHTDPGNGWDWDYYIQQVNGGVSYETVYVESRSPGQNYAWYSDDASWGSSSGWCNGFDSHLTAGGSRYLSSSGTHWCQVQPTLGVPGGKYSVDISHYGTTNVSTDITASVSLMNCTGISGTTAAFQAVQSCNWVNIGQITLYAGQTQPTVRFDLAGGTIDGTHRWNTEGFRFTLVPTASVLTLTACPGTGGTVTGGGSMMSGDAVTATASPKTGYTFTGWTTGGCGGTLVSTDASYTFTMPGQGYALYANFTPVGPVVTTVACPSAGGATSGDGAYVVGSSVTVNATANAGYTFANWTTGGCGGTVVSSSPSYTFTMPSSAYTLYANFTANTYTLAAYACSGGTVAGGGSYTTGQTVTVTATPNPGMGFLAWSTNGCGGTSAASWLANYTLSMPSSNYSLYGRFQRSQIIDGFENRSLLSLDMNDSGGANEAANGNRFTNPWCGPSPSNGKIVNAENGVTPHGGSNMLRAWDSVANCQDMVNVGYRYNSGAAFAGSIYLDWWFYDPNGTTSGSAYQDYAAVCYYGSSVMPTNADYGSSLATPLPAAAQSLALGATQSTTSADTTKYQARVLGATGSYDGNGWFNTSVTRSVGWHHARILVGPRKSATSTNDVSFYIDDMTTPALVKDSTTTIGYNSIQINGRMSSSSNTSGYFDDLGFGAVPDAPGAAAPTGIWTGQIIWHWVDASGNEDGFHITDSQGALKGTTSIATTGWTEAGLSANTQYGRWVSSYAGINGYTIDSSRTALPATYTLAVPPVYGSSGSGAVFCDRGAGGASAWYLLGTNLTFSAANGIGAGAAKASGYSYVWNQATGEPDWNGASEWASGQLVLTGASAGAYYLHLRALNGDGVPNTTALVLGPYTFAQPVNRISEAWGNGNGAPIALTNKTVTAALPGFFWIEEADRTAALKVAYSGSAATGHAVNVYGALSLSGPQRLMTAGFVEDLGTSLQTVAPLGAIQRALGGSDFNASTPGATGATGLYNVGMLVRIAGSVTYSNSDDPSNRYFFVDDGSGLSNGGHTGIKVLCGAATPPASGMVTVTGVVDLEESGAKVVPVLVVRDSGEIRAL